ncbi:hypothetical protein SELMODRAFT_447078 [Selaginella moellendorffii]|uniref:NAD-dependent epimerase/dehydratase domain-containing protein n=1 Tax=Selaginella moellendorffii TaxID=88036 RepID=D8SWI3_SELML|nr:hypothetical protein SELMODRAFT_447078 [Selaginella moellendorffii]
MTAVPQPPLPCDAGAQEGDLASDELELESSEEEYNEEGRNTKASGRQQRMLLEATTAIQLNMVFTDQNCFHSGREIEGYEEVMQLGRSQGNESSHLEKNYCLELLYIENLAKEVALLKMEDRMKGQSAEIAGDTLIAIDPHAARTVLQATSSGGKGILASNPRSRHSLWIGSASTIFSLTLRSHLANSSERAMERAMELAVRGIGIIPACRTHLARRRSGGDFSWLQIMLALVAILAAAMLAMGISMTVQLRKEKEKPIRVVVVGASGFLGYHLALGLQGNEKPKVRVVGIDARHTERSRLLDKAGVHMIYGNVTAKDLVANVVKLARPQDFSQQEHAYCLPINQRTLGGTIDAATTSDSVRGVFFASPNRFYMPSSRSGEELAALKAGYLHLEDNYIYIFLLSNGDLFAEQIVGGQKVPLWRQRIGNQNYIHVDDAVKVMKQMVLGIAQVPGVVTVVDIGTPEPPLSFRQVIEVVSRLTGKEALVEEADNLNPPPWEVSYVAPTQLYLLDHYISFDTGMRRFLEWYEQRKKRAAFVLQSLNQTKV